MKIAILSDLHLSDKDYLIDSNFIEKHREDYFLCALMLKLLSENEIVIINGDLLEMYQSFNRRSYFKKIQKRYPGLFSIISASPRIVLINGNHDCGSLKYFKNRIALDKFKIHGYLFEHGDLADSFFSSKIKKRWSRLFCRVIYGLEFIIGKVTKFKITKILIEKEREERTRSKSSEKYAFEKLYKDEELKGVVLGHTHQTFVKRYEKLSYRTYFNSGSYLYKDVFQLDTDTGKIERITI